MMARCAKGKAVRTYFIQVEKKYRAQSTQVVQPQVSAIDPAVFSLFPPAVQALISITHEQVLIKREQDAHATRIAASEKQIAALERQTEAMGATHDWFTALGWVSLQKLQIPIERIKELGKKASQLCHSRRIEMGRVADPRFGKVNSYPKEILAEAAASLGLIVAPPSLPDLFDN
jgi:hypothetical protein